MCGAASLTPADDHVADRWITGQTLEWSGRGRGEPVVMTERTASTG
jgi:hypothetical protein